VARRSGGVRAFAAKLSMPKPSAIHSRARLLRAIDSAAGRSLVWIHGPAGSGKTTLAVDYIRSRRLSPLWYRIDARDADPAAFFYYLRQGISRISPRRRETLSLLTGEYFQALSIFAQNFFDGCYSRLKTPAALVFDDFHDIPGDSLLLRVLPDALAAAPEDVAVLVLSRLAPPPEFAAQIARGSVLEIHGGDLNFTPPEARALARLRGATHIPVAALAAIQERTEGWAAGLQLTFDRMHDGAAVGEIPAATRERLFAYFATELLDHFAPAERELLLKTSVLEQTSAAQAETLAQQPEAGERLAGFARRNLFTVRLEGKEPVYRYHPLFRDFLHSRLKESVTEEAYRELCRRAAALVAESGSAAAAGALLIEARDHAGLAALILSRAEQLVASGRYATLAGWISQLPTQMVDGEPWLAFWRAIAEFPLGPTAAGERMLAVMRAFRSRGDLTGLGLAFGAYTDMCFADFANFRGFDSSVAELIESFTVQTEFPSREIALRVAGAMLVLLAWTRPWRELFEPWAERALALLRETSDARLRLQVTHHIALYHFWCGEGARAQGVLRAVAPYMNSFKLDPVLGTIWAILNAVQGWYSADRNAWETAVQQSIAMLGRAGIVSLVPQVLAQAVFGVLSEGDLATAVQYLSRIEKVTPVGDTLGYGHYLFMRGWEALVAGEPERAVETLTACTEITVRCRSPVPEALSRVYLAQALVETRRIDEAKTHLEVVEDVAARMHSIPFWVYAFLTRAHIAVKQADRDGEVRSLSEALRRMREADLVNFVGWSGDFMARVLNRALVLGIELEFVRALIRRRRLRAPAAAIGLESWPWPVRIRALGRFSVQRDDAPLSAGTDVAPRPLALLKALIALGGRDVEEAKLAELLWPEAEGDSSYQSLKVNVQRLRRALGEQCLAWSEGRLSLDSRYVWTDVWALERALGALDSALAAKRHDEIAALASKALSLNRGAFLRDDSYSWALGVRERLRERFLRIVGGAAEELLACGKAGDALRCCEKALEIDPVAERFYQGLIRCYTEMGEKADALTAYRRCRNTLARELQVAPSARTEALHAALLRI
jgi:ATP/maltotriose-dependent transcriptional regulator MalT/DNA-binding SARP family transcriptional activator